MSGKFPVYRDVRVGQNREQEDPSVSDTSVRMSGRVTVMGFDKNDVLFKSDEVGSVQWRDSEGNIVAILVRLRPDIWGFSKLGDEDWEEVLKLHSNPDC